MVPALITSLTGGAPQDTLDPDASGKAIQAIIKRMNLNTQPVFDNITFSIEWSGEVYQAIAAEIYNKPRIVNTIAKDGTESREHLFKIVTDEQTGKQIEANDLRGKKFHAFSDTGPQYETQREQTVEDLKGIMELMKDNPQGEIYMPALLAMLMNNISGVGLEPLKELNRKQMILQGLVEPETDEEEEFLQQASQPQPDPNEELVQAAAQQQMAEARSLDASSLQKTADAQLKEAQTAKTLSEININEEKTRSDIEVSRIKTLADIRNQVFQNVQRLPLSNSAA